MASPSTPTHGKVGALYRLRPNGFKGNGLNDITWGTGFNGADSAYFEAVIDHIDSIKTVAIGAAGTGYTALDVLTVVQAGGSGGTVTVDSVDGAGAITGISLTTVGQGYAVANGLATTGGTGSDGTVNITAIQDSYKWRKDGGAWTEDVGITGAAQTLSDSQTITFAAPTGHTADDQWIIGNLKDEPCTESSATAQVTDTLMRLLNPNVPPTFTDDGGKTVLTLNYTNGTAVFTANVGAVTVTGNNGYIPSSALEKVGYLIDWNLDLSLDMTEISRMGQKWKEFIPGQAGGSGGANAYFIGVDSFFELIEDNIDQSQDYFVLELFNYDPDQDQTGDHIIAWVIFNSWGTNPAVGDVVKEAIGFQVHGMISFKANA